MAEALISRRGGGGGGLNFRVIGGTSNPSSPKANDIWVNTSTAITSWDFSATEPYRRSGNKNLIVYPWYHTTTTTNGITFTDNGDGTVKVNGTTTADTYFRLHATAADSIYWMELEPGTYTLSDVAGTNSGRCEIVVSYDNCATTTTAAICSSGVVTFTLTKRCHARVALKLVNGKTFNNVTFKPQLEKGSTATSFIKGNATGQVWIATGDSSTTPFNALKKNNITVYPVFAKQYVSGKWVNKTAKSYQGDKWVDWYVWDGTLFPENAGIINVTGGWVNDPKISHMSRTNVDSSTVTEDAITIYITGSDKCTNLATAKAIDLTGYSYLEFNVTDRSGSAEGYCMIYKDGTVKPADAASNMVISSTGEKKLEVPSGGGSYRIAFELSTSSSTRSLTISEVRLMK